MKGTAGSSWADVPAGVLTSESLWQKFAFFLCYTYKIQKKGADFGKSLRRSSTTSSTFTTKPTQSCAWAVSCAR